MSLGAPAELPAGVRKEMEGLGLMTALHHAPMQATDDDGDYKLVSVAASLTVLSSITL